MNARPLTLLAVAGLGLAAAIPLTLPGDRAFADTGLTGYTLHATAPGVELQYDSAQFPTPTHPAFTGTLPEATADLETGPTGRGFASLAWPGAIGGNLGTTIQQINFCAPASVPVVAGQCLPDQAAQAIKQILKPANDPVRAEARTPAGPSDAAYGTPGALYMTSHATGTLVTADGGVSSVVAPPVVTFGSVTSRARALLDEGVARSEATSSVTGLAVGTGLPLPGGLPAGVDATTAVLAIDSVITTANATSDGEHGDAGATTLVGGVRVLGVPSTIDAKGIHVGPGANVPTDAATAALIGAAQQALAAFHVTVSYSPEPKIERDASSASATATGMVISFVVPDGTTNGSSFRISLGKAVAASDASPEFNFDVGGAPVDTLLSSGADSNLASTDVLPATISAEPDLGAPTGTGGGAAPLAAGTAAAATGPPPGGSGLSGGVVFAALAVAALLGLGFKRLSDGVLTSAAAGGCPEQGEAP